MSNVRERANAALQKGDVAAASTILSEAVDDALRTHGPASFEAAVALSDLAGITLQMGQVDRAEDLLRRSLEARGASRGKESVEYAVGQAALAEVLAARGRLEDAELLVDSAASRLGAARTPDWPAVVALRAVLRFARYGDERSMLEPFDDMDKKERGVLVRLCLQRASMDAPPCSMAVLTELRERIEDGDDPDWDDGLLPVLEAQAQVAGALRKHDVRLDALGELESRLARRGNDKAALEIVLARAATLEASGDKAGGEALLHEAGTRAESMDDAARSHVLRARGVTADARGQADEASKLLTEAVAAAERAGQPLILALARAARGIFEQHAGRSETAKTLLTQAITGLPNGHPDQRMVGIHLDALSRGADCGCRDGRFALARRIEALAAPMLPPALVRSVHVLDAAAMKLDVVLARQPTEAEGQAIQRALEAALQRLRPPAK